MIKIESFYPLILESFNSNKSFTFPIKGTSMLPLLSNGDLVTIIKINNNIKKGDIVFYKREDSFILHRIRKIKKDNYYIVGDHQTKLELVKYDQLIGLVINYQKNNKTYNMKGVKYNLYKFIIKFKFIRFIFSHIYK